MIPKLTRRTVSQYYLCTNCLGKGKRVTINDDFKYCPYCGERIEWDVLIVTVHTKWPEQKNSPLLWPYYVQTARPLTDEEIAELDRIEETHQKIDEFEQKYKPTKFMLGVRNV